MANPPPSALAASPKRALTLQITTATLGRLLINTSRRFVYPFAPALSRGLGVPLPAITSLIAVNQFTGLLSPLFGPLSDRWGYRVMMMAGLGLVAVGMLAGGFLPFYATVLLALFLAGLGKSIFDPALQAYVGERVPYQRRGMVVGLVEMSWAGSTLVGIPVAGYLIQQWGWRAPFFVIGGLGLLAVVGLGLVIPRDNRSAEHVVVTPNFWQAWRQLRRNRAAMGMLAYVFFISIANDNLFVVYGAWLENRFALGIVALGTATTVIGIAELVGETLVATISDRLGLKRAITIGVTLSTLSYVLLPALGQTLPLALVGLFITFVTFEFTVVTSFSLTTELLPGARATMLAAFLAMASSGRVIGALIGGPVWLWGGIVTIGTLSTVSSTIGLLFFLWGLRRWQS